MNFEDQKIWDSIAEDWSGKRRRQIKEVMNLLEKTEGNVLDMACGSGRHFSAHVTHACDFSEIMLNIAKKNAVQQGFDIEISQCSMEKTPYEDDFFNYVFCISSLHCMDEIDQQLALKEIFRILKPGAMLVISV